MRLTTEIRDRIFKAITKSFPQQDYLIQLGDLVQAKLIELLPEPVALVYRTNRRFLTSQEHVYVEKVRLYQSGSENKNYHFYGLVGSYLTIRTDPRTLTESRKGTLEYTLTKVVIDSGLLDKHLEQDALIKSVSQRLKATLGRSNTTNGLRDNLEPELHKFIPEDPVAVHKLPALSAPVVSDLRSLGLNI